MDLDTRDVWRLAINPEHLKLCRIIYSRMQQRPQKTCEPGHGQEAGTAPLGVSYYSLLKVPQALLSALPPPGRQSRET